MKFISTFLTFILAAVSVTASSDEDIAQVPAEAIIGYLDFGGDHDIAFLPFSNATASGLFLSTPLLLRRLKKSKTPLWRKERLLPTLGTG
ncbi:ASN_collapsed_G0020460.mRNA.1.CDS.1 [Saccharomyces cerevisiae]|nr:ASN_collapsed_G0020460.mRNA.1.CDS.1 [Saccharomyces cerevisiae]